jgi:hypothetical protein
MKCKVLGEYGLDFALLGLSLSYNTKKNYKVAKILSKKQRGHNKFLESMMVWLDIEAPMSWWKQMDTYRMSTKQSESTMHTLLKKELTQDNFEHPIKEETLQYLNELINKKDFLTVVDSLPMGFKQRRIVCLSYKTLQNIYMQRTGHKLIYWKKFITDIIDNLEHAEFIK